MNENKDEMEVLVYEVGYHLTPTIDESEILTHTAKIRALIEENSGSVISEEMPKLITLAYEIYKSVNTKKQKFNKAFFGWIKFEMAPMRVLNLKKEIENLPEILRLLVIKTVKENTMHTPKMPIFKKENPMISKESFLQVENPEKEEFSEEEIDKTIDELVDNQTL